MTTTKTRIKAAKRAIIPEPAPLPFLTAYHNPESGRYWLTDEAGRGGVESEYSRYITPAEFAELERTHQVILVIWTEAAPLP
jgi:hypothetical protein